MKRYFIALLFLAPQPSLLAQSPYLTNDVQFWELQNRYEIASGNLLHTGVRSYQQHRVAQWLNQLDSSLFATPQGQFNRLYMHNSTHIADPQRYAQGHISLGKIYENGRDALYWSDSANYNLAVNPVILGALHNEGYEVARGIEVSGQLEGKLGFYTYLTESLLKPSDYVEEYISRIGAVPGEGFVKKVDGIYDTFTARGHVTFSPLKAVDIRLGHDRIFSGFGNRSMLLNNETDEYLFLQLNTQFWRLRYTNIFAQLVNDNQRVGRIYPRKFMAMHRLGVQLLKNLEFGISETILFSRQAANGQNSFELEYLNPIIFYRALEQDAGDPDNVLFAFDAKYNFLQHFQLYGQLLLDEFKLSELRAANGWWANKYSWQLGGRYINMFGIEQLDGQIEYNSIRPYTYAHFGGVAIANHQHFRQPLAHPAGANLNEINFKLRYQPLPRITLRLEGFRLQQGRDTDGLNYGSDVTKDYTTRVSEYGNDLLQGNLVKTNWLRIMASYQLHHSAWVDIELLNRSSEAESGADLNTQLFYFTFRMNTWRKKFAF